MKNIFLTAFVSFLLIACNSEESKIQNALLSTIPEAENSEYVFNKYTILENLFASSIEDSISNYESLIYARTEQNKLDSVRIQNLRNNQNECRSLQSRVGRLYDLRSDYDDLINDYEDMIKEVQVEIEHNNTICQYYYYRIKTFRTIPLDKESPIVLYKIIHEYELDGIKKNDIVFLDSKFKPVKL